MTPRERYLETVLFGQPDKVPLSPGGPRESTLRAWRQQGLPAEAAVLPTLGEPAAQRLAGQPRLRGGRRKCGATAAVTRGKDGA